MSRAIVHRGVVHAAALLFDEALLGPLEARRRVIAVWTPGATVHRLGEALLVRLAAPTWIDCARAPGLPLVAIDAIDAIDALSAAPLEPDEIAAIAPIPRGAVVRMHQGALTIDRPLDADREDPATYLDLEGLATIDVTPLGAPPVGITIVEATKVETRKLLGVGAAPPELAKILQALRAKLSKDGDGSSGSSGSSGGSSGSSSSSTSGEGVDESVWPFSWLEGLFGIFGALFATLLALLGVGGGGAPSTGGTRGGGSPGSYRVPAGKPEARPRSSFLARMEARLRGWLAELLVRTRLARHLTRRQAAYISRLMEMFDRGDLTEALRHAIPLGGPGGLPAGPAFGVPRPRSSLGISLAERTAVGSLFMSGDLFAELTRLYRKAFERLEREGRIDEAAFVLVELLNAVEEGVAFLERHGQKKAAAELAEARQCPPGLVVRQWFIAGDRVRAARIARRFGAFADAIDRMKGQPEEIPLRVLWAETLASAGDLVAAVEVLWPVEAERSRAAEWIDAVIDQGGAAGARMLVKKLELSPDALSFVLEAARGLLGEDAPQAPAVRRALAEALLGGSKTPAASTLARPLLRALIEDGGRHGDPATTSLVTRLVAFAGDDALRSDLPTWPAVTRVLLKDLSIPLVGPPQIVIDAADTGSVPVLDAAHLPTGQTALALGEAGVRVLHRRPDGASFHLDQPAYRLVVSDHGDRALALSPRGDALRIARLDLRGRRSEAWCEARLDALAPDFNGSEWVVADGPRLFVIDAADAGLSALHRVPVDGRVLRIDRTAATCSILTGELSAQGVLSITRSRYDGPSWTLRVKRKVLSTSDEDVTLDRLFALDDKAAVMLRRTGRPSPGEAPMPESLTLTLAREVGAEQTVKLPSAESQPIALELSGAWVACALRGEGEVTVLLLDEAQLTPRTAVKLGGAKRVSLSLGAETLTIGDDRGRVLVIELIYGGVLKNLRT